VKKMVKVQGKTKSKQANTMSRDHVNIDISLFLVCTSIWVKSKKHAVHTLFLVLAYPSSRLSQLAFRHSSNSEEIRFKILFLLSQSI